MRQQVRRAVLSALSISTGAIMLAETFNRTYTFNPSWSAHARFHMATSSSMIVMLVMISLWLLWRRGGTSSTNLRLGGLLGALHWLSVFPALTIHGVSPLPDGRSIPHLMGLPINLVTAALFLFVGAFVVLGRSEASNP